MRTDAVARDIKALAARSPRQGTHRADMGNRAGPARRRTARGWGHAATGGASLRMARPAALNARCAAAAAALADHEGEPACAAARVVCCTSVRTVGADTTVRRGAQRLPLLRGRMRVRWAMGAGAVHARRAGSVAVYARAACMAPQAAAVEPPVLRARQGQRGGRQAPPPVQTRGCGRARRTPTKPGRSTGGRPAARAGTAEAPGAVAGVEVTASLPGA